jgi:hypothetical protein
LRNGIGNLARHVRRRPCPAASLAGEEAMTDLREAIARAICEVSCLRRSAAISSCIDPTTGRNTPCQATRDQLILSGRWLAAEAALAAIEAAGWQVAEAGRGQVKRDTELWLLVREIRGEYYKLAVMFERWGKKLELAESELKAILDGQDGQVPQAETQSDASSSDEKTSLASR